MTHSPQTKKRLSAAFWCQPGGREPVREWLRSLTPQARRLVGQAIGVCEYGWPAGLPECRKIAGHDRLWEIRTALSDGRAARVLFTVRGGTLVLLHGFIKNSRRTPIADLTVASRRNKGLKP